MNPQTVSHVLRCAVGIDLWLIAVVIICRFVAVVADAAEKIASGGQSNSELRGTR